MRAIYIALLATLMLLATAAQVFAQNVSINATITGEVLPGVYGQVMLGNRPPPAVLYAQPVVAVPVVAQPVAVEPIYLHVPPGHAKHWREHCREYHACNRPVYFVKSAEYEPGYQGKHEGHGRHEDEQGDREHGHHDD